jgi:hypothetical protein
MMKEFFKTNGAAFQASVAGFQKNDWFKTLMRLKAQVTGMPMDNLPADAKTRKWMELVHSVLPPEMIFPQHKHEDEQGSLI